MSSTQPASLAGRIVPPRRATTRANAKLTTKKGGSGGRRSRMSDRKASAVRGGGGGRGGGRKRGGSGGQQSRMSDRKASAIRGDVGRRGGGRKRDEELPSAPTTFAAGCGSATRPASAGDREWRWCYDYYYFCPPWDDVAAELEEEGEEGAPFASDGCEDDEDRAAVAPLLCTEDLPNENYFRSVRSAAVATPSPASDRRRSYEGVAGEKIGDRGGRILFYLPRPEVAPLRSEDDTVAELADEEASLASAPAAASAAADENKRKAGQWKSGMEGKKKKAKREASALVSAEAKVEGSLGGSIAVNKEKKAGSAAIPTNSFSFSKTDVRCDALHFEEQAPCSTPHRNKTSFEGNYTWMTTCDVPFPEISACALPFPEFANSDEVELDLLHFEQDPQTPPLSAEDDAPHLASEATADSNKIPPADEGPTEDLSLLRPVDFKTGDDDERCPPHAPGGISAEDLGELLRRIGGSSPPSAAGVAMKVVPACALARFFSEGAVTPLGDADEDNSDGFDEDLFFLRHPAAAPSALSERRDLEDDGAAVEMLAAIADPLPERGEGTALSHPFRSKMDDVIFDPEDGGLLLLPKAEAPFRRNAPDDHAGGAMPDAALSAVATGAMPSASAAAAPPVRLFPVRDDAAAPPRAPDAGVVPPLVGDDVGGGGGLSLAGLFPIRNDAGAPPRAPDAGVIPPLVGDDAGVGVGHSLVGLFPVPNDAGAPLRAPDAGAVPPLVGDGNEDDHIASPAPFTTGGGTRNKGRNWDVQRAGSWEGLALGLPPSTVSAPRVWGRETQTDTYEHAFLTQMTSIV